MALTPGTRLGSYEITAQIGVGGMGEVYRATDTNLKRQVAIKVLPASVAGDTDRLARFQREAEVLAALNHPHIAAIYGLEKTPEFTALVMELVEGDDLSQRIARGTLPMDEALPIAKQIAGALEAAHEQGIIHRDLKPANIKVRADGTVKVLDFGLAKAMEPASGSSPSLSMSPTITTPAMTQAGMILGTAAYMSPEQAKGRAVDARADVWAFGVVLFEMVSGQRAFDGEDIADVLGAVVRLEPRWDALPASLPPRVMQVLRGCLQKNVKARLAHMQDVRLALDGAFEDASDAAGSRRPDMAAVQEQLRQQTDAAVAVVRRTLGRRAALVGAAALMAGVVAGAAVWSTTRPAPPAAPETRLEITTPATDEPDSFALSPDGRQVVFVASGDGESRLWLRPLGVTTAQPLAGTEGATLPFWSPDGRSVGFFAGGALRRLDLGGGAPRILAPATYGSGGTWSTDGAIVFAPSRTTVLQRVSAAGGPVSTVTTLGPQQLGHSGPFFLPDGRRFLFFQRGGVDGPGIYLGALGASTPVRLTPAAGSGMWLPSGPGVAEASREGGWLLWVRDGTETLVAQRLDVDKGVLTGEPKTVADGVGVRLNLSAVSVSASGLVAYRTGTMALRQLTWVDRSGTAQGTLGDADATLSNPRVSPDGRRVVVERVVQGNADLWLLDGPRTSRFTFDPATDRRPVWSPDGSRIAFTSSRTGTGDLYQKLASGAGAEERIVASDQAKLPSSWSADGLFLAYYSVDPRTEADLWVAPMLGGRMPWVFLKTSFGEAVGAFSPDGRWVAYQQGDESGGNEVYVRPFVPPSPQASAEKPGAADMAASLAGSQWQVSTAGGILPVWRPDGKELYYLTPAGEMMAASIAVVGTTLQPGAPTMLFPTRIVGGGGGSQIGRNYDVAPDGRFLINTELDSAAAPITLIQDWAPGN